MVSYKTDNAIRLDHTVINSTLGMDERKGVPTAPTVASGPQLQNRNDTSVGTSVSGVIRRRNGLQQGLRSPAAKRPFSAPVTLQGWLHKQGSEGLMLWKKRWFVLTEYCIFYYKGPEEEKLLGSILLPSYKVTICEPEEKVNKKFAFKAEHANMRTYFFAADTREGMNQWVNVLTLATFLQDPTPGAGQIRMAVDLPRQAHGQHNARPSVSSMSSVLNNSTDDSDSGFHGFQSRDDPSNVFNNNPSPNSSNTTPAACRSSNNSNMAVAANGYTKNDSSEHILEDRQKQEIFTNGWIKPPGQFGYQDLRQRQQYDQVLRNQGQKQHHHQQQQQQQFLRQQQMDAHQLIANYQQTKIHQHIKQSQHVKLRQHQHQSGLRNVQSIEPGTKNFGHRVYANAPPKPRRFADESIDYSTSLPDTDLRTLQGMPSNAIIMKSPMVEHERGKAIDGSRSAQQQSQVALRTDKSGLNYGFSQGQPAERRTPDTYGRSGKPRIMAGDEDYEDVYTGSQLYKRPVGPVGYKKSPAPVPIPVPMYTEHQQNRQPACFPGSLANVPGTKTPRSKRPPRPHSADFLDYETTRRPQLPSDSESCLTIQKRRPQRPKSSLDVVNATDALHMQDDSFISEERDAGQVQRSVVYRKNSPQELQQLRNQSFSSDMTSVESYSLRVPDVDNNNSVSAAETPCQDMREPRTDHFHEQHRINMQSLQRYSNGFRNDAMMRRSLREMNYDPISSRDSLVRGETSKVGSRIFRDSHLHGTGVRSTEDGLASPAPYSRHSGHVEARHWREQQLARSASARLPRMRHFNDRTESNEYPERSSTQSSQDGERRIQQREESMKRLIEWKQRMLHSPLTRKPATALINPGVTTQTEMSSYYKRQALLDLAAHEAMVAEARHSRRRDDGHTRPHLRSKSTDSQRSAATNVSRYNSYSSDDEELDDVRRKRGRKHPHAAKNSRHHVEETPMPVTSVRTISNHDVTGIGQANSDNARANFHHQVTFLSQRSSPRPTSSDNSHNSSGSLRHPTGIIPPGSAYEEISFPQTCKKAYTIPVSSKKQAASMFSTTSETLSVKTPKKPSGILKSPTNYLTNQQQANNESESLIISSDYSTGETWQSQKNVQFDPADERQNWYAKIDESKVIKEFSYQYIKPDERTDMREEFDDQANVQETKNLVQSRIRSFESSMDGSTPVRQISSIQEPLTISTCPAIDVHASRLDSTRKNAPNNCELTLQEETEDLKKLSDVKSDEDTPNYAQQIVDNGKTVKDLLADFEKKSQQAQRSEDDKNNQVTHRGVFSDTETLLYDTESDLDQRDKSDDEEDLYQTINKHCEDNENHTGTIKKNQHTFNDKRDERRASEVNPPGNSSVVDDFYGLSNSEAFSRLGMTESTVNDAIDYSDDIKIPSADSDIENINVEEHYLPMTPRKAILDPNNDDRPNPKIMESLFANLRAEESSYVEMAQNGMRHSLLAPNDDGERRESGDYSTLDTRHYEFVRVTDMVIEPVYMEVNQLSDKAGKGAVGMDTDNQDSQGKNCGNQVQRDLKDILGSRKSDSSDADDESSKDLDSIDAPRHPRFSLSDTFRPASYYLGASRIMIADLHDSSDSDLVSPPPIPSSPPPLEELDSLNIQDSFEDKQAQPQAVVARDNLSIRSSPRSWNAQISQFENRASPSRFSESGTSLTCRESRISIESTTESEQCELRNSDDEKRHIQQLKRRPVSNEVCEVLDSLDEFESLGNRFASTGIDLDEYLEELQARDAFNVDIYAKDLSYNSIYGFNENRMVMDKLQKPSGLEIVTKMNLNSNNSLDRPFQYDCRVKAGSASSLPSMKVSDALPSHQHSQSFTGDAHYENLTTNSPLRGSPTVNSEGETININCRTQINPEYNGHKIIAHSRESSCSLMTRGTSGLISSSYDQRNRTLPGVMGSLMSSSPHTQNFGGHQSHVRSSSHDSPRSAMTINYRPSSCQDPTFYTESALTPTQLDQISSAGFQRFEGMTPAQHAQNCNERDQNSAPYYYSDLQVNPNNVNGHNNFLIGHTSRLPQLNNQRSDSSLCLNKRNDIGRLVNQITHQMPREIEVEDIDESRLIAAALRMSSSQYFVEKRSGQVDRKNVYEADTLRRAKSTDPIPNEVLPDVNTINLYPLGLRNKSNSQTNLAIGQISPELEQTTQSSHRRSRSLEGLLNNVELQNLVEQRKRTNELSSVPSTSTQQYEESPEMAAGGSDFATGSVEDATGFNGEDPWEQDTLWRESLRRVSLRHARSLDNLDNSARSIETVQDSSKMRPKITRGATYVNDSVVLQKHQRHASPEERPKRRSMERNSESGERSEELEEENPYERLAINHRLTGDYVWDPENEAYRRQSPTSQHNQNHSIKSENHFLSEENLPPMASVGAKSRMSASTSGSFELDREKLRQWDLVSSACLLQEQQRTSMAESARGLPMFEDQRRHGQSNETGKNATKMIVMNETSMVMKKRRNDPRRSEDTGTFEEDVRKQSGSSSSGRQSKTMFDRDVEGNEIEEDK